MNIAQEPVTNLAPLYQIAGEYAFLSDLDAEGDFDEALAQLGGEFASKAEAILRIVTVLEGQAGNFKAEVDRIAAKGAAMQRRAEWLKDYLRRCMTSAGIDKLEAGTWNLALQASPPSVEIVDEQAVPEVYMDKVPETWKVNKARIIAAFKVSGEAPAGVVIHGDNKHLRVR